MTTQANRTGPPPGKFWWITLIRGLTAFGLGLSMLLTEPPRPLFVNYMGMYWLASGITSIGWGLRGAKRKGLWLAAGIVGIMGGASVITRQFYSEHVSQTLIVGMFGVIAILTGLLHMFGGFRKTEELERVWSWESLILGIIEIGLGVVVFLTLGELIPIVRIAAILWALVGGLGLLLQALHLRGMFLAHLHYPQNNLDGDE